MPNSSEAKKQTPDPRDAFVPHLERLNIIRELMMTMTVVTQAGQHHVMIRAVEILRSDISRTDLPVTDPRTVKMADALREMQQETMRVVPRPGTFNDRAKAVLDSLSAIWGERTPPEQFASAPA